MSEQLSDGNDLPVSNKPKMKTVYFHRELLSLVEEKIKAEYVSFSSYVKKLIVEDLKKQ